MNIFAQLQKIALLLNTLVTILFPSHVNQMAVNTPAPSPTPQIVQATTPTPTIAGNEIAPASEPVTVPTPDITPAPSPTPDQIDQLINQINQFNQEVASLTPAPIAPISAASSPSPTPMPTPELPVMTVKPIMTDTDFLQLPEPSYIKSITIQIVDADGNPAAANGATVTMVNGDGITEGPTRVVFEERPLGDTNPVTLQVNHDLYRKSRLSFGVGNPPVRVHYKVTAVDGATLVIQ